MSVPIHHCELVQAVKTGNFSGLKRKMEYNIHEGHFSILPCRHFVKCRDLSKDEIETLNREVFKEWNEKVKKDMEEIELEMRASQKAQKAKVGGTDESD